MARRIGFRAGKRVLQRVVDGQGAYPSQLKFFALRSRFQGFSGPVGTGKSRALGHKMIQLAYANPGCEGLIAAQTYKLITDTTMPQLRAILEEERIPHHYRGGADNMLIFDEPKTGMYIRTLADADRLRGLNLAFFGVDELTYATEAAWNELEKRLRSPKARFMAGVGAFTPRGFDWVWERFIDPSKRDKFKDYEAILAKPNENKAVLAANPLYYEQMRNSLNERQFRQEALGEYLRMFDGQAYWAFEPAVHIKPVVFDPRRPILWSLDFNLSPMCSVICQEQPPDRMLAHDHPTLHVLDEIFLSGSNVMEAVNEFRKRVVAAKTAAGSMAPLLVEVYGDPAGNAGQHNSGLSSWQLIKEWARQQHSWAQFSFRVGNKAPEVASRVNAVNRMLRNAVGDVHLAMHPRCKQLQADFDRVAFKADKVGNFGTDLDKSDPMRTHLSDALGYLIADRYQLITAKIGSQLIG